MKSKTNVIPVLAFIDSGSFNNPDNLLNSSYQYMLDNTYNYVLSAKDNAASKS